MKRFVLPLVILAASAGFEAQADNPPPGLLAKIQIATQAHQQAGREFKDLKKFVKENESAQPGGSDTVQGKKHGSLDVAKLNPDRSHTPGAIGKGIGGRANDGGEDR